MEIKINYKICTTLLCHFLPGVPVKYWQPLKYYSEKKKHSGNNKNLTCIRHVFQPHPHTEQWNNTMTLISGLCTVLCHIDPSDSSVCSLNKRSFDCRLNCNNSHFYFSALFKFVNIGKHVNLTKRTEVYYYATRWFKDVKRCVSLYYSYL